MTRDELRNRIHRHMDQPDDAGVIRTAVTVRLFVTGTVTKEMLEDKHAMNSHWDFMIEALLDMIKDTDK